LIVVGIATKPVLHVVLLTPKAKLLDCRAASVILPCSDGERGILRNHCPMLTGVGRGIMQVHDIHDHPNAYFVLEGGFARFSENNLTVLAYDAITFTGVNPDKIKQIISHAQGVIAGQDYTTMHSGQSETARSRLILRMAEMSGQKMTLEK
jgi:ATP synthase F1 epsilon subunit